MIQLREPRREKKYMKRESTKILETGGNSGDKFLKRDLSWHGNNFRRVYWRRLQLGPRAAPREM